MSIKRPKRKRVAAASASAAAAVAESSGEETATLAILTPAAPALDATAVLGQPARFPADPIVALSSNSTVKDAGALKAELMKVLDLAATVAIDVRSVERVDTATMQLLCAFVRDRAARNVAVQWLGCPPAIADAARLLGVQSMLCLPTAGAA